MKVQNRNGVFSVYNQKLVYIVSHADCKLGDFHSEHDQRNAAFRSDIFQVQ